MEINIYLEDRKVSAGKSLPVEAICGGQEHLPEGRKFFHWAPGQPDDDIEGEDILVTGIEYGIGHRRYDLSSGYALKVRLTPKNVLIPYLQKAQGREIEVIKKNGISANAFWPLVVRIWEEPKPVEKPMTVATPVLETTSFIEDAIFYTGDMTDFSEDFDFDNMGDEDLTEE